MPEDPYAAIATPVKTAASASSSDPYASIAQSLPPADKMPKSWQNAQPTPEEQAFLAKNPDHQWLPADNRFPNRWPGIYQMGPGSNHFTDPTDPMASNTWMPVDLHLAKHTYEGAKAGLMAATAPLAIGSTLPQFLGGLTGAAVGEEAGRVGAKHLGAGETAQEVAGDVTGLIGGGLGANTKVGESLLALLKPFGVTAEDLPVIGSFVKGLKAAKNVPEDIAGIWKGKPTPEFTQAAPLAAGAKPAQEPSAALSTVPVVKQPPVQANALGTAGKPVPPEPSAGLGSVPVRPLEQPLNAQAGPSNAGAPLPATPERALLQSAGLAEGGKPTTSPADVLGKIPVEQQIPGVNVRPNIERLKGLFDLPVPAVNQAIKELGPAAPLTSLTERANQIANGVQEALGGKGLEPNVPLKNQFRGAPKAASDVVPVERYSQPGGSAAKVSVGSGIDFGNDKLLNAQKAVDSEAETVEPGSPREAALGHISMAADIKSQTPLSQAKFVRTAFAFDGDRLVGGGAARISPDGESAEITHLGSIEKGAGSQVLEHLENQLEQKGVKKVTLTSTARDFYQKQGYALTSGSTMEKNLGLQSGHIPVESSAMNSYKYDPLAQEFEVKTDGGHYVYGDVSPAQAKAFEASPSKGKAWNVIRQNSTLVAKIVNGKRVPIKPVANPEDAISPEEWEAGQQMETQVEGTPRR